MKKTTARLISALLIIMTVVSVLPLAVFADGGITVNYYADGATNVPASATYAEGVEVSVSTTIPNKNGYDFLGWAEEDGGSVEYQPGNRITESVDLYAVFQRCAAPSVKVNNKTVYTQSKVTESEYEASVTYKPTVACAYFTMDSIVSYTIPNGSGYSVEYAAGAKCANVDDDKYYFNFAEDAENEDFVLSIRITDDVAEKTDTVYVDVTVDDSAAVDILSEMTSKKVKAGTKTALSVADVFTETGATVYKNAKEKFFFNVTDATEDYGKFTCDLDSFINDKQLKDVVYRAGTSSGKNYDSVTVDVYYGGTDEEYFVGTSEVRFTVTTGTAAFDFAKFDKEKDIYVLSTKTKYSFELDDFEAPDDFDYDLEDLEDTDAYLKVIALPELGTLKGSAEGEDVAKLAKNDIVYLEDIETLEYSRSEKGTDRFTVSLYDEDDKCVAKNLYVWVVDDESLIEDLADADHKASSFNKKYDEATMTAEFAKKDFTANYTGDIKYVVIKSLPSKGDLVLDGTEITKVPSKIALANTDKLTYEVSSKYNEVSDSFTYYIVDADGENSNTATVTVKNNVAATGFVTDFTVATSGTSKITFSKDLFNAASEKTVSKVMITELPKDGVLKYSGTEVSKNDVIAADKLTKLTYVPDGSTDEYTDSFKWNATTGSEYAKVDATCHILVFPKPSKMKDTAGDFDVNITEKDSYTFTSVLFKNNYFSADDNTLKYIVITTLPSNGTLYLGTSAVKKNEEIAVSQLGKLSYVASGYSEDRFTYYAIDSKENETDNNGVVTINYLSSNLDITVNSTQKSAVVKYTPASSDKTTANCQINSAAVKEISSKLKNASGYTLKLYADTKLTSSSFSFDPSFFTADNAAKITKLAIYENAESGSAYLLFDMVKIANLYAAKTYTGTFTVTISSATSAVKDYITGKSCAVSFKLGNKPVTFTEIGICRLVIPYVAAANLEEMCVVINEKDAKILTSSVYVSGLLTAVLTGDGTYTAVVNVKNFPDVLPVSWYYNYISNLAARNVIGGYPDGTFGPDKQITRAEYIKLLVESLGLYDATAQCSYTDIAVGTWFYPYIASAVKAGVLDNSGKFDPDTAITRQDMAKYSYLAAQAAGIALPTESIARTFNDQDKIPAEYAQYITAMQRAGIISGDDLGNYNPQNGTKRSEAAKIISMLIQAMYN